jgi:hypothetical protein
MLVNFLCAAYSICCAVVQGVGYNKHHRIDFSVDGFGDVTDAQIDHIVRNCPDLTAIFFRPGYRLSETALQALRRGCPDASCIVLGCEISEASYLGILQQYKSEDLELGTLFGPGVAIKDPPCPSLPGAAPADANEHIHICLCQLAQHAKEHADLPAGLDRTAEAQRIIDAASDVFHDFVVAVGGSCVRGSDGLLTIELCDKLTFAHANFTADAIANAFGITADRGGSDPDRCYSDGSVEFGRCVVRVLVQHIESFAAVLQCHRWAFVDLTNTAWHSAVAPYDLVHIVT